jgi:replicative DNA helicase
MDELLSLRLPHNLEAEQSVIGSVLIDSRCLPDVIDKIKPADFYIEQNRDIYQTILTMYANAKTIDAVTVFDALRVGGVSNLDTLRTYIGRLMEITPTAAHAGEYARIVKDHAMLRSLAGAAGEIAKMVNDAAGETGAILDAAEQKIYAIRQDRANQQMYTLSDVFFDVFQRLNDLAAKPGELPGLPTGFPQLDSYMGGLIQSNLIIIASNTGMGKTSAALNIALHAAKRTQKEVAFFSLEMSREQLGLRLLSGDARVDSKTLLTGRLNMTEWDQLAASAAQLAKLDLLFDDNPALGVLEIKAKCRRLKNLGLVIIDYLQLIQPTAGKRMENRVTEVGEISRALKIMAKELNVPVVCLSQLSRRNTQREDKRPLLSDLRESGAIEQDADAIIFLHREAYHNRESENPNEAELIVAKNRHGETGSVTVQWAGEFTSFLPVDRVHVQ